MRAIEQLHAEGQAKPARKPRPARVFTADGEEVLITLRCPHCRKVKPLSAFGLRRMADGKIRSCPWCRTCRSRPGVPIQLVVRDP